MRKIKVVDFIHGKKDSDKVNTNLPFTTNYKETKSVQSANVVIASYTNKNSKDIETLKEKNYLIENNINDIYNTLDIIDTALNNISSDIEDINIEINNLNGEIINKQETLISGENIKTINNNSILGSGNIEISSSGGTWGEITGTISDQTDLQNALDEKADISDIPTKTSDLTNDSGFITNVSVPTKTSDLTNDSDFITTAYHDSTKQDILTAGNNIEINNNVINAVDEYSTNEVIIGKWVDGRNIYRKTIPFNFSGSSNNVNVSHNINNLNNVINVWGVFNTGTERRRFPQFYYQMQSDFSITPYVVNDNYINIYYGSWCQGQAGNIGTAYVIIEYTKTTDNATIMTRSIGE